MVLIPLKRVRILDLTGRIRIQNLEDYNLVSLKKIRGARIQSTLMLDKFLGDFTLPTDVRKHKSKYDKQSN